MPRKYEYRLKQIESQVNISDEPLEVVITKFVGNDKSQTVSKSGSLIIKTAPYPGIIPEWKPKPIPKSLSAIDKEISNLKNELRADGLTDSQINEKLAQSSASKTDVKAAEKRILPPFRVKPIPPTRIDGDAGSEPGDTEPHELTRLFRRR